MISSLVILSAIFTNKFLKSLGIPSLLFFLAFGLLFGVDGVFKVSFADFSTTKDFASIALGFIIFYGGFCTKWITAKPIIAKASVLSTLGVFLTSILTAFFCYYFLNLELLESFLIGSVIASTDAASVFSILRSKNLSLKENTAPLLEIESGSNDPMSYVLVVLAMTLMMGNSYGFVFVLFLKQMIFGILIGVVVAKLSVIIFRKTSIITDGNEPLFIIAIVLLSYAIAEINQGNPFLAVYFLGIVLGNSRIPNKLSVMSFFDGITKLAQIGIFFMMGLLATPQRLLGILGTGSLIFVFLSFVVRPIVVFLLLFPFKSSFGQMVVTSWAGLRGVASIVFAIIAGSSSLLINYDLFHLVFLISVLSLAVQGSTLPYIAKVTNMLDKHSDIRKTFNDYQEECAIKFIRLTVPKNHEWVGQKIREINFPHDALVLYIRRDGEKILPQNSTKILANDIVTFTIPAEGLG